MHSTLKKYKNLIPVLLLIGVCLHTAFEVLFVKYEYNGQLYNRSFSTPNLLAFALVSTCTGIYFLARKFYKVCVVLMLLLAFGGLINFTADTYVVNLGVPFEPVAGVVGLLYLILNFQRVKIRLIGQEAITTKPVLDPYKVEDLKQKYRHKTAEELVAISRDKRFTEEGRTAANELLK